MPNAERDLPSASAADVIAGDFSLRAHRTGVAKGSLLLNLGPDASTTLALLKQLGGLRQLERLADFGSLSLLDVVDESMPLIMHSPGYYADTLLGGGLIYWDQADTTTAHDGVNTFVDARDRRWKRIWERPGVAQWHHAGCRLNGTDEDTDRATALLTYLDSIGGGTILHGPGEMLTDTLHWKSGVHYRNEHGRAGSFKLIPHTTTHNPVIVLRQVENVEMHGLCIDGSVADQTYPAEEWSPCISVASSNNVKLFDPYCHHAKGDGITIGYLNSGEGPSTGIYVVRPEVHDAARQALAVTWGDTVVISEGRMDGLLDLENNAGPSELVNIIVENCSGRGANGDGLALSFGSVNTNPLSKRNIQLVGNTAGRIIGAYSTGTRIVRNRLKGLAGQLNMLEIDGTYDTLVADNYFDGNSAVATSLTALFKDFGNPGLVVTNNKTKDHSVPFHSYSAGFGAVSVDADHPPKWKDNQVFGTGAYHDTSPFICTEEATIRLDVTAGVKTWTQISGTKLAGLSVIGSGGNVIFGSAGSRWTIEVLRHCNTSAAGSTTVNGVADFAMTPSGSARTVTFSTRAVAGTSWTTFDANTGTATFFIRITF